VNVQEKNQANLNMLDELEGRIEALELEKRCLQDALERVTKNVQVLTPAAHEICANLY
jgi:hypothetical protein